MKTQSASNIHRGQSKTGEIWHRFRKNKGAILGLGILAVLVLVALTVDIWLPEEKTTASTFWKSSRLPAPNTSSELMRWDGISFGERYTAQNTLWPLALWPLWCPLSSAYPLAPLRGITEKPLRRLLCGSLIFFPQSRPFFWPSPLSPFWAAQRGT